MSHRGLVRSHNEDSFVVAPEIGLYAVADGMGGAAAGEVASRLAVDTVHGSLVDPDITWPRGFPHHPTEPDLPLFIHGVERANASVHAAASRDRAKAGMGTTFTGLLTLKDRFALAHVGDSRAYLLRGRRLEQLTVDHTLVNMLVQIGKMTPEEAAVSPRRNILTRAVGPEARVTVDSRVLMAVAGDTVLLASDGLHGVIDDSEIEAVLVAEHELTRAATRLIECANDAGGPDNITVVLLRVLASG
jgi:serine/threonine protein phosphatase PrpC